MNAWPGHGIDLWRRLLGRREGPSDRLLYDEEAEVVDTIATLTRGFGADRRLVGRPYFEDRALLGAYLLLFAPISHAQAHDLLRRNGLLDLRGREVWDIGCGPGPVAAAAIDLGAERVLGLDGSALAVEVAVAAVNSPAFQGKVWRFGDPLPEGQPDLVLLGHVLNEIGKGRPDPTADRAAFVRGLVGRLAPGGRLLVLEPANHERNADLLRVRDVLAAEGLSILGPCTREGPCPALAEGAACHAAFEWDPPESVARLADRAHLDKRILATSWLLIGAEARQPEDPQVVRVVSDSMLNKAGRHRRLVCGPQGRFPLSTPPRDGHPRGWAPAWKALDRHDRIRVIDPEPRERGWALGDGSRIERA